MSSIGRRFDRESSSVFSVLSPTGGIRPADRRRSQHALSLSEREEISRGLGVGPSLRRIAGSWEGGEYDAVVGVAQGRPVAAPAAQPRVRTAAGRTYAKTIRQSASKIAPPQRTTAATSHLI